MSGWALADAANLACVAEFGEPVTYTGAGQRARVIRAIFNAAHETQDFSDAGEPVSTVQPAIDVRLVDLAQEPLEDDAVVRAGVTYRVTDVQPDGRGMATLLLVEAP